MARSARIAVLSVAALVAAASLALSAGSGHHPPPSASRRGGGPATDPSSTDPTSVVPLSDSPPTTTAPAADPVYPVGSTRLTVPAHTISGDPVAIPVTVWYPDPPKRSGPYPLLTFSPGYQIDQARYDLLTTAWAKAGYVVAEPTYPDTDLGAPAVESDMVNHPTELRQVITALLTSASPPLEGMLDASEVAVAGQSDGGDVSLAVAASTCCRDPRVKAAVILSGAEASLFGTTYYGSGNPPLLAVQGNADTINPPGCSAQLFDAAGEPRYYLDIPAATHLSAYTVPGPELDTVEKVTTAFLDGYVKGMSNRVTQLAALSSVPGVSSLTSGPANLPVSGTCPGAPGGA